MNEPKVTVYLSTYNQVKYIHKALDSIFMQETSFPYEVVVADDFSTDGTRDVILEYQARYPDILKTYFTPENVGNCQKTINCFRDGVFRGEYVSMLEGDDYWLETDRLQILVDFLDAHPEYVFVSYKEHMIDIDGNDLGPTPDPSLWGRKVTIDDFLRDGKIYSDYAGVFRNFYREDGLKYAPIILASRNVWDYQNLFMIEDHGPVYLYDLTPAIRREQLKLLMIYEENQDLDGAASTRDVIDPDAMRQIAAKLIVWEKRRGNKEKVRFLYEMLSPEERRGFNLQVLKAYFAWAKKKLKKEPYFDEKRGYKLRNE